MGNGTLNARAYNTSCVPPTIPLCWSLTRSTSLAARNQAPDAQNLNYICILRNQAQKRSRHTNGFRYVLSTRPATHAGKCGVTVALLYVDIAHGRMVVLSVFKHIAQCVKFFNQVDASNLLPCARDVSNPQLEVYYPKPDSHRRRLRVKTVGCQTRLVIFKCPRSTCKSPEAGADRIRDRGCRTTDADGLKG
jgi:hypothetical protein